MPNPVFAATYALTSLSLLQGAPASLRVLGKDPVTQTAVVALDPIGAAYLSLRAHETGRCGGFEALAEPAQANALATLTSLRSLVERERALPRSAMTLPLRDSIQNATKQVESAKIRDTVSWFSSFPTRFNRDVKANAPVEALRDRLQTIVQSVPGATVELISHHSTPQKSVHVHIPGSTRPSEIVVLGGHLDSINRNDSHGAAPGADDNASGVASLTEALRLLVSQPRTERSIDFFFYAGEESGLLGSAEIAQDFRDRRIDVVGVLQLDMTLFAGSGPLKISSMKDFTSAWMRELVVELVRLYVPGASVTEDECGYGCSDHASWFRRGYATAMPFESNFDDMNHNIHTPRDVIDSRSDFEHAAGFSKLALALALELGNSTAR